MAPAPEPQRQGWDSRIPGLGLGRRVRDRWPHDKVSLKPAGKVGIRAARNHQDGALTGGSLRGPAAREDGRFHAPKDHAGNSSQTDLLCGDAKRAGQGLGIRGKGEWDAGCSPVFCQHPFVCSVATGGLRPGPEVSPWSAAARCHPIAGRPPAAQRPNRSRASWSRGGSGHTFRFPDGSSPHALVTRLRD